MKGDSQDILKFTTVVKRPQFAGWLGLMRETWDAYQRHNSAWLAAALAYFTAFSVAPLIIVLVEVAGFFLHDRQDISDAIYAHVPPSARGAVRQIVAATVLQPHGSLMAQLFGWTLFGIAAIGWFSSLQFALNTIWDVPPRKFTVLQTVKERAFGFAIMLVVAAVLTFSVVANALLTAGASYLTHIATGLATLTKVADFALTFVVVWVLFAVIFEYLPDARIAWREVWLGAGLTSLLFVIGQFLLGWYLGRAAVSSAYGAFGSLAVFLLWADYSAQIVLLGAEFTHVHATYRRSGQLA